MHASLTSPLFLCLPLLATLTSYLLPITSDLTCPPGKPAPPYRSSLALELNRAVDSTTLLKARSITKKTYIMDDDRSKAAAQAGDIDLLYTLIQEDPHVLEYMDGLPFVETPLHIAAAAGQLQFATEIMRLKPSFAWKLNQQGFSPIHLALLHGHKRVVLRFVDINSDLVRVKRREGLTPLHYVSQTGDIELLAYFLRACPDSIEDVTVRSETALHVAVKNQQYEALQVLVGWLKRNRSGDAMDLEKTILNWKDDAGNTILHLSILFNDPLALGLLVKAKVDLNAKNLANSTALDIADGEEMKNKLVKARALRGSAVSDAPPAAHDLKSNTSFIDRKVISILRIRATLSDDQRNCLLVVAALVATATYQAALSPPGGLYQAEADSGANNVTTTALNSTYTGTEDMAGKSVLSAGAFTAISVLNMLSLLISTVAMYILLPSGKVSHQLFTALALFVFSYLYSMRVISPTNDAAQGTFVVYVVFYILYNGVYFMYVRVYERLERCGQRKEIESRNSRRGNRW